METDISLLKLDVSELKTDMSEMKMEFRTMRGDLDAVKIDVATLRQRFDSELPHLATKAEIQEARSETRTWIASTGITLLFALGGMQFSFFSMLKETVTEQIAMSRLAAIAQPPLQTTVPKAR
jgi:hypothetical protein